jgi:hypothetical protein
MYMQQQILKRVPRKLDRSPRLDTIIMVEKALYKYRSDKTLTAIWRMLPKKVMWTTYLTILNYLEYSGKIHIEKDKTVTWLWDPKLREKMEDWKRRGLMIK